MSISNITKNLEKMNFEFKKEKEEKEVFDIENEAYIEPPFHIIESYFKGQHLERLVRHQLESYNNFVGYQIIKTIEMFNPVHIASEQDFDPNIKKHSLELFITFENFNIYRPQIYENNGAIKLMFPQEARLRNFTYASAMTVDINIKYVVRTGKELENIQTFYKTLHKIHIGKLPIMLKSNICVLNQYKHIDHHQTGECRFDAGGYFIINGSEKTVLGQERAAENRVYCFNISKNNTKYNWLAEIKSVPDFKCISPKQVNMMLSSKDNGFGNVIHIQIPRVKQPLPLFMVFRALGVVSDKEICEKVLLDIDSKENKPLLNALQASIIESSKHLTQEEAIKYITSYAMFTPINMDKETGAKKKLEFTMEILNNDLFPHCHNITEKIHFLGYMAHKLLKTAFKIIKVDDRDSYANKRVDLTGTLLNNLFRNYFNKLVKDMEKQIIREINNGSWRSKDDYEGIVNHTNIYKIIKSTTIENGIKRALATGDFGIKNTNSNKVGVAQVLNRLTYVSSLSHARRISTPTDKSGKLIPPRKLHNTSWGFLCLTGDTNVLLSNRIDSKKIKDIKDGDWVNTVNRNTLLDEPSDMSHFFGKMPDKLYEIITISGRKIKATADHPFLVRTIDGKYEMKKVGELMVHGVFGEQHDEVVIRHMVLPLNDVKKREIRQKISEFISCELVDLQCTLDDISNNYKVTLVIDAKKLVDISVETILSLFSELEIECFISGTINEKNLMISISNVDKFVDLIDFTYCDQKRVKYAPWIEHYKILRFIGKEHEFHDLNCLHRLNNGCISVPILSINEIEPEMVYDFTTRSENHSFVASSFVVSNCPAETPEGQSVGIVKNLSYMTHITIYSNSQPLYEYILPNIQALTNEGISLADMSSQVKVFINGAWVGITDRPQELFWMLKEKKYTGMINIYTSIIFDYRSKEIRVCNDGGRLCRPLLRIRDNQLMLKPSTIEKLKKLELTWDDLFTNTRIDDSVLEYIDPDEQNHSMIATVPKDIIAKADMMYKYTHCEIHPSTMFGVLASCIPFPENNQSPRNCYQCAQGKQAMGVYVTNYENRMDKTAYVLNYPTRPLVDTRIMNMIQLNKIPSGTNVIVAIMTHTGYNQEDSLLFNKGSIDRGLFVTTVYHTEKDEDKQKINGDEEIRCKPDPSKTKGMKMGNYQKVNNKGVIPENTIVENRDIIISKVVPIKENRNDHTKIIKFEDQSRIYRTNEETYIDKNYIDKNGDGYNFAKIRLRTVRKPVIGDKFSSRHGQKGTIGNIIPEADMPFTSSGVKPDIIINPHAIPSRMTIGQLKETLLGKVLVNLGLFGDGTSFGKLDVNDIRDQLIDLGYEAHGNELLYNGLTGEQVECSVFMGPVFYQRLKHMVIDKAHSRSIGPMVNLTRQPAEGRSRDGGLRFGEMERDGMISHGASRFTRERMYDVSDKYHVHVCKKCGLIASYNDAMNIHHCKVCDNRVDFSYVEIPYACKLLFQELNTMNVVPRIMTDSTF